MLGVFGIEVGTAVSVSALLLLAVFVLAQYRRGVVSELREALNTAASELQLHRDIVKRLEAKVDDLDDRCSMLEAENKTLRDVLASGSHLAPIIREEFERFHERTVAQHKVLAQVLRDPERTALLASLDS